MSDIIDFSKFQKKVIPTKSPSKLEIDSELKMEICEEIMTHAVNILDQKGFNVRDPDLLHDLEIVAIFMIALMNRYTGIEDKNINDLDSLRGTIDDQLT